MSYLVRRSLGATNNASSTGLFDDLLNVGEDAIDSGREEIEGGTAAVVEKLLRSSQFKKVLDAVENKAEKGVKDVIGQNALGIVGLAVSAGTLGGFFGRGKVGIGVSLFGMGVSLAWLVSVNQPSKTK